MRSITAIGLGLVAVSWFAGGEASALAPDRELAQRQHQVLVRFAADLAPSRSYTSASDCFLPRVDAQGLLAVLELRRRGDPVADAPPQQALPSLFRRIADALLRFQGIEGSEPAPPCTVGGTGARTQGLVTLAYILHRFGRDWPAEAKEAMRRLVRDGAWPKRVPYLHNQHVFFASAALLTADATGDQALWDQGRGELQAIYDRTMRDGGIELESPHYSYLHFAKLLYLMEVADPAVHAMARTLFEYELLVQAHLYLPGGGLGPPHSRDKVGGYSDADNRDRDLGAALWVLIGDPEVDFSRFVAKARDGALAGAATDYVIPDVIRSIFLEKGNGYTFWAREGGALAYTPQVAYRSSLDPGVEITPWRAFVLPGGLAMHGLSYGYSNYEAVTSGTYVRCPSCDSGFAILYQYQPAVAGDADERRSYPFGLDGDPDDFCREGYDFERMAFYRSAISLWDPTDRASRVDPSVQLDRLVEGTRVFLPNWDHPQIGGSRLTTAKGWRVGRVGEVYVGFRPLGKVAQERVGDDFAYEPGGTVYPGYYTFLRLDGRSGGIVDLATTSDYPNLQSYAADLDSRHVQFRVADSRANGYPSAEFDARDAAGHLVRLRLEYRPDPDPLAPERRWIDRSEPLGDSFEAVSDRKEWDRGLLHSPWVVWDGSAQTLTVSRTGYGTIVYDVAHTRVEGDASSAAPASAPASPPRAPRILGSPPAP